MQKANIQACHLMSLCTWESPHAPGVVAYERATCSGTELFSVYFLLEWEDGLLWTGWCQGHLKVFTSSLTIIKRDLSHRMFADILSFLLVRELHL